MKKCELCSSRARVYCESDEASLCWDCDARVHAANFLVAKHTRILLCNSCQSLTPWTGSGSSLGPTVSVCHSCFNTNDDSLDNDEDDDSSSSDEDEGDNQIVPMSTDQPCPPPSASSSSSSSQEFTSRFYGRRGSVSSNSNSSITDNVPPLFMGFQHMNRS